MEVETRPYLLQQRLRHTTRDPFRNGYPSNIRTSIRDPQRSYFLTDRGTSHRQCLICGYLCYLICHWKSHYLLRYQPLPWNMPLKICLASVLLEITILSVLLVNLVKLHVSRYDIRPRFIAMKHQHIKYWRFLERI